MKVTIYELLGMVKDGKASDITTNFMLDKKEMDLLEKIELMNNLRLFLNPYKYEENVRILEKRRLDENNIYSRR